MPEPNAKQNAKQQAEEYQARQETSPEPERKAKSPRRSPEEWNDLISQRIEEAMRQGAFDNLPGRGKPLDPAPDPFTPPDMQMANSLLKNNDLVPAWIGDRNATLVAIAQFRNRLLKRSAEFDEAFKQVMATQQREQLQQRWHAQVETWRHEVVELNRRIQTQNLKQPVHFLEIYKLVLEEELRKVGVPGERMVDNDEL